MEDWERIIFEMDKATNGTVDKFIGSLAKVSKNFYEQVVNYATQLKLRIGKDAPKAAEMAENLRKLTKLNNQLQNLLMQAGYQSEVSTYISYFQESQKAINTYYSAILSDFKPSQELFLEIRKANVATTIESLLNSGVDANFIEPVKKVLRDVVIGNGDYTMLKNQLRDLVIGNDEIESRLKSYVGQVSSDSIKQFQRNYLKAVSDDIGLKHYLYRGTEIASTRDFCQTRHGKYFTKEQVQSWSALTWSGKARGTDKVTIFTYCGGYACRHALLPVSETIYKAKTKE